jgi:hypothetical protein
MAGINIIDGLNVNATAPVDYRLVVGTTASRDLIQYKYNGLPVFVESNRTTYVWNTGTLDWDIPFAGAPSMLAVINNSGNGITASIVQHGANGLTFLNTDSYITTLGTVSIIGGTGVSSKGGNVIILGGYAGSPNTGGDVYINSGASTGNLYLGYDPSLGSISGKIGVATTTFDSGISFQVDKESAFNKFTVFKAITEFNTIVRLKALSESNLGIVFNSSGTLPLLTGVVSAAYVKSNNYYSSNTTPDYTWYGDTTTGMSHPGSNIINLVSGGIVNMWASPAATTIQVNDFTKVAITPGVLDFRVTNVSRVAIVANDLLANIHQMGPNGVGFYGNAATPWINPAISSGVFYPPPTHTPGLVATVISGVSALSPSPAAWIRVGNIVSVSGHIDMTIPAYAVNSGNMEFVLTLPIKPDFGARNYWQLSGVGKVVQNVNYPGNIEDHTSGGDVVSIHTSGGTTVGAAPHYNKAHFKFWPRTGNPTIGYPRSVTIVYAFQYILGTWLSAPLPPNPIPPYQPSMPQFPPPP